MVKPAKPAAKRVIKAKPVKSSIKPLKAKQIRRSHAAVARLPADEMSALVLDRLYQVVLKRRTADPALSHSARLLSRGRAKVAQKFGEEAVEAVIEGVVGDRVALISESADVLYHLLVLWAACDVTAREVWTELARREGVSGVVEKAARPVPRDALTRKIP